MNDELYQKLTTSRKYRWVCPSTVRRVLEECGHFDEIIEAKAGCTVFCHCGPDTLGLVFLRK